LGYLIPDPLRRRYRLAQLYPPPLAGKLIAKQRLPNFVGGPCKACTHNFAAEASRKVQCTLEATFNSRIRSHINQDILKTGR
jgi:hypothetical protein